MRRTSTWLAATFLVIGMTVEAQALVYPLSPDDSVSVFGKFLCATTLPCGGGEVYEFTVTEPTDFEAAITFSNFTDVTLNLFPASSPGLPLEEWTASSPGTSTLVTLAYAGLMPGIVYNFTIYGSVPMIPGLPTVGMFEGQIGAAAAPVSTVPPPGAPVSAVPLPGALWLFVSGLATLLLGAARRR